MNLAYLWKIANSIIRITSFLLMMMSYWMYRLFRLFCGDQMNLKLWFHLLRIILTNYQIEAVFDSLLWCTTVVWVAVSQNSTRLHEDVVWLISYVLVYNSFNCLCRSVLILYVSVCGGVQTECEKTGREGEEGERDAAGNNWGSRAVQSWVLQEAHISHPDQKGF